MVHLKWYEDMRLQTMLHHSVSSKAFLNVVIRSLPVLPLFSSFFFIYSRKRGDGNVEQDVECVCAGLAQRQIIKQLCVSASE